MTNISSTPCGPLCIPIPNMLSHVKIPMQVEIFFTFHDRATHDASVHPLAQVSQKPVVMPLAREEHGCIVYPSLCYKSSSVTMHCSACLIRCFADFVSQETTQSHERRHAKMNFVTHLLVLPCAHDVCYLPSRVCNCAKKLGGDGRSVTREQQHIARTWIG